MKRLHRPDLFGWSLFNEDRNIDFHSVFWAHPQGNVAIDPLPVSTHDRRHIAGLGGLDTIVVTNSDHIRAAPEIAEQFGARICGPAAERDRFPIPCQRWLADGDEVVPGLEVLELEGSKTAGELSLLLEATTLITGDLVRAHEGGRLCLLPDAKLSDRRAARASVARLAALPGIDVVLVGDGWPVFRDGGERLRELLSRMGA